MFSSNRSSSEGRLPDFIIIGAPKAGTTSLDFYLSLHPEIHMARPKEPRFFIDAAEPSGRWSRGQGWYRSLFRTGKKISGEASPAYTISPALPGVPERMALLVPNAKFIYLVREPMARLRSVYYMSVRRHAFQGSFAEYIEQCPRSLAASCYGTQLEEYLRYFSLKNILIVESKDLRDQRQETLDKIFRFIGANPGFSSPLFRVRLFVGIKERFPSQTGRRIQASRLMQWTKSALPPFVFHHFRNFILLPFGESPPSVKLPPRTEQRVKSVLRDEVALLRQLTGQKLDSLEVQ